MRNWIKSNSILIGVDFCEPGEDPHGMYFLGLNDGFSFSINNPRSSVGQMGSQEFSVNDINFSPDIEFSLSFTACRHFQNEDYLGFNFGYNQEFTSILNERAEKTFNLYLFLSDQQGYDFIKQIKDTGTLNGVECLAFGNCHVTQYGLSLAVSSIPKTNFSFVASNMEMSIIADERIISPAINLATGTKDDGVFIDLGWNQVQASLNELAIDKMPILPTTEVKFFQGYVDNFGEPTATLTPLTDPYLQSLNISLSIEREAVYGFASNFPYSRKIKFPIQGRMELSCVMSALNTGQNNLTGLMQNEGGYIARLDFLDPQEMFLSGLSGAEISGFIATGVSGATGMFTDSRSLLVTGAKLDSYSHEFPINGLSSANLSFSFQAYESGGLMARYGYLSEREGTPFVHTEEARKIIDTSGEFVVKDSFLYVGGQNCLVDGNGLLLLADNWTP